MDPNLIPEDIDEQLTEEDAVAQAKAEGIEFVDYWTVDGVVTSMGAEIQFPTEDEAKEAAQRYAEENDKDIEEVRIVQYRTQK